MTLFERASTLVIGTFPVYLQDVSFHASQREEDVTHVQRLADAFSDSDLLRWAHPIELVLSQENEEWVRRLSTKGKVPPLPRNLELLCISGKHRVLAAQRYFEEHGNLDSWPAIIYKAEMLECSWLEVYMTEKNTPRYRLPTTQRDLLLGLDRMIDSNPDMNVYALVTKHGSDASAVESLHKSRLWPSLFRILENGFLSDIRKEVLVNWPTRYRMYQTMALLFDDCVFQHRQLAAAFKRGWTMDTLYGHGWSNKQTLAKSGEREEVEKVLEGDWWSQFGQQSAEEFWRFAGTRAEDGNGGPKGEPFFFGSDWISNPHALAVHRPTRFLTIINQAEAILSLFCALLFPDNIPTLRERRPRKNQRDHDWAGVLVELAGCTILDAIQVIRHTLRHRDQLYDERFGPLPSEEIRVDKFRREFYVHIVDSKHTWLVILNTLDKYGFHYEPSQAINPNSSQEVQAISSSQEPSQAVQAITSSQEPSQAVQDISANAEQSQQEIASSQVNSANSSPVRPTNKGGKGVPKKPRQNSKRYVESSPLKRQSSLELSQPVRKIPRRLRSFTNDDELLESIAVIDEEEPEFVDKVLLDVRNRLVEKARGSKDRRDVYEFLERMDETQVSQFFSDVE